MASALDDEDDIPLPADVTSTAASEGTAYDALLEQPQPSALGGGGAPSGDYGGGGETGLPIEVLRKLAARATRNPAPEGTNRAALQNLVRERMAQREKEAVSAASGEAPITGGGYNAAKLQQSFDPNAPDVELSIPKPEEPPPEKPGIVGEVIRGAQRGAVGLMHELEGVANTVNQKLADWTGSEWLAAAAASDKKELARRQQEAAKEYGATVPSVVAAFNDPSNAPRYIAGKAGEIIPTLVGYVTAGVPRMVMFGAIEGANRAAEENNGDLAATVTGATVGAAVAGAPAPFLHGAAGKSLWQNIARATLGMPLVGVAGTLAEPLPKAAATGVYEPPSGEQIAEAAAGGVISGPLVGAVGYRASRPRSEVTPGVTEEQKAALDLTKDMEVPGQQPPLELTPDMVQRALPPPSPENRPPIPPGPPGEAAPAAQAPDVIAGQAPPGGGGQPVDFTIGQPPAGPAPPTPPPPGGPVPPPRPQPFAPTERPVETQPTRPGDFGIGAPTDRPAQPPPPMTTPEEFGIGRPPGGEEPPPPAGPGGPPPPPRPQPFPPSDRPAEQRPTRPEDFTIGTPEHTQAVGDTLIEQARQQGITTEPDDLNKGRFVAKVNDQVAGKGATEHEALADLISRKGAPYPPEPGEVAPAGAAAPEGVPPRTGDGAILRTETAPAETALLQETAPKPSPAAESVAKEGGRDVTEDVRTSMRSDKEENTYNDAFDEFTKREEKILSHQKRSDVSRANELERRQAAWDQGFEAGLRDGTMPAGIKQNVVNQFREGRELGRQIREERMAAQSPAEKAALVKAKGEARVTEKAAAPGAEKAPEVSVTKPSEIRQKTPETPGQTGEKSPAERTVFTTPGEAAEPTAKPATREELQRKGSPMAREVRAEGARHERESLISEGTRKMAEAPPREEQYPVTPGLETGRKAQAVIKNILAGQKLIDAVKAFGGGRKEPGSVGRPPNVERLSDAIREELKTVEDTSGIDAARQKAMDEAAAALQKLDPDSVLRRPILNELNKQLNYLDQLKSRRPLLEKHLSDIEAIERGEDVAESRRFDPTDRGDRVVALSKFKGVNQPTLESIRGGESSLHKLLDGLINNPIAQRLTPPLTELAKILRRVVPESVVHGGEQLREGQAGKYDPVTQEIHIDTGPRAQGATSSAAVSLLHETVHRGTADYITHLYTTDPVNLTPRELAHKTALDAIRTEVQRVADTSDNLRTVNEFFELDYATRLYDTPHLVGPHEIATQLLTQPDVYAALSRERASPEFRQALDNVGLGISSRATIWDGFKRILRSIFGVPERLDSVMDHAMRPLSEILETGGRFRRPAEAAELREISRSNNEVLGAEKLRDSYSARRLEEAVKNFGGSGGRAGLTTAFYTGTLDAITNILKPLTPSVVQHQRALEDIKYATTQERTRQITTTTHGGVRVTEPHLDKTLRLQRELKRGPDGDKVQRLMTEATMAEVSLADHTRNDHLVTQAQKDNLTRLQQEFSQLDPRAQSTYKEIVELYADRDRVERQARIRQFAESALPDLTRAQHDDVVRHMQTVGGIEDIITNTDRSALAQALGPKWANSKDLVDLLAKSERGGHVRGDYFPLHRYGDYVVVAGEAHKPGYIVKMFESNAEARTFKENLEHGNPGDPSRGIAATAPRTDVSEVFTKSKERFTEGMRVDQMLGTLDRAMAKSKLGDDAQKVLRDLFAGQLIQQGTRAATNTMRRERIEGASNEQARNLMTHFNGHTTRVGHLMHQGEVLRSMFNMEKERDALRRSGAGELNVALAETGTRMLRRRMAPVDGDTSSDLIGRGARAMTVISVADALIRPMHLIYQAAGGHIAAASLIAGRHGLGSVGGLTKAYAQLTTPALKAAGTNAWAALRQELKAAHWDLAEHYRTKLKAGRDMAEEHVDMLIDALNRANLINQTKIREMQRMAGPDGWLGNDIQGPLGYMARALDAFGAAEHSVDSMARVANAKAAFMAELRKQGNNPEAAQRALEYAMQIARRATPDYNEYNKSMIASTSGKLGALAPVMTQYKQFAFHMYGLEAVLLGEGLRNAKGSAERREAIRSLAYLNASHALIYAGIGASVFNMVPVMFGLGLWDLIQGGKRPHTATEAQTAMRNYIKDQTGSKTLADIWDRGLPAGLFNLDASRSLMLSNLIGLPELKSFDAPGMKNMLAQIMTGASGDVATGLLDAFDKIVRGDTRKENFIKLMPRVIEDPLTAALVWPTEGVETAKGDRVIVPANQLTGWDLGLKAIGGIPLKVSDARQARAVIDLHEKVRADNQGRLLDDLVESKSGSVDRKEALAAITRYNQSMPRAADRITGQQIQSRLKAQATANAIPTLYGMNVPRKQRSAVTEETRFARP